MKQKFILIWVLSLFLSACTSGAPIIKEEPIVKNGVTATQDYFDFFDPSIYHEIVIEVKAANLDQLDVDMNKVFEKYGHYKISSYVSANFIYREDGKEKIRINEVGLRTHGNVFSRYLIQYDGYSMNSLHWRVSFDETFNLKVDSEEYDTRKKRDLYGLENLVLKWNRTSVWSKDTTDPYITESYGYQLYEDAGIPSSKASLVHVIFSIDGKEIDQGVMTMIEPVDDEFLQKRYSKEDQAGNLYKALWQMVPANMTGITPIYFGVKKEEQNYFPPYDIKTNEDTNHGSDLRDFIKTYQTKSDKSLYDYLNENVNLDEFMKFNAMNYLFGNPDDMRYNANNYYLYFDSSDSPKLNFMPTDLDKGLGITDWNPDGQEMKSVLPTDKFSSNGVVDIVPLLSKTILSTYDPFVSAYLEALNQQVTTVFTYPKYLKAYQMAYKLYHEDASRSKTRTYAKPMGLPDGVRIYYCVQTYKVLNLKQPTTECN
jgi:spore coat protein CotH